MESPECQVWENATCQWVIRRILRSPCSEPAAFQSQFSSFAARSQSITVFSSFIYIYLSLFIYKCEISAGSKVCVGLAVLGVGRFVLGGKVGVRCDGSRGAPFLPNPAHRAAGGEHRKHWALLTKFKDLTPAAWQILTQI